MARDPRFATNFRRVRDAPITICCNLSETSKATAMANLRGGLPVPVMQITLSAYRRGRRPGPVQGAFRAPGRNHPDADALKLVDMILDNATAGLINLNLNQWNPHRLQVLWREGSRTEQGAAIAVARSRHDIRGNLAGQHVGHQAQR